MTIRGAGIYGGNVAWAGVSPATWPDVCPGRHHQPPPERTAMTASETFDNSCTCIMNCDEHPPTACSLAGQWHVHPAAEGPGFGPCVVHPEAPGDH